MWQKFWPDFYPRSPCGERPSSAIFSRTAKNFYPRSPCGERRLAAAAQGCGAGISIHALLAESDCTSTAQSAALPPISIHALLAESDERAAARKDWEKQFLSTLSLRRATIGAWLPWPAVTYFYPRSPCGERLDKVSNQCKIDQFLSTLSLRRATSALAAEENPTQFLSTLSLRRATLSKTIPRGGHINFYPRSPCGERRASNQTAQQEQRISIHALLAESDLEYCVNDVLGLCISIHALLAESDA